MLLQMQDFFLNNHFGYMTKEKFISLLIGSKVGLWILILFLNSDELVTEKNI